MKTLEVLLEFYAVPYYPATIIFLIACIRSLFFRKKLHGLIVIAGIIFALLPSIAAIGFVAFDLISSGRQDQHWITAIVLTYAGVGIVINLISLIIFTLYLYKRHKKSRAEYQR